MNPDDKLRLDYDQTYNQFRMLADIRFKLLGFVPLVSGAAISLLAGNKSNEVALAVGLLGFLVTLGIVIYELRNTQFYDGTVHRAKWLEVSLDMPSFTKGAKQGGLYGERPPRTLKLFGIVTIKHDHGLALIYGTVLGAWIYLIVDSLSSLLGNRSYGLSILVGASCGSLLIWEIHRLSSKDKPQPTDEMHERLKV